MKIFFSFFLPWFSLTILNLWCNLESNKNEKKKKSIISTGPIRKGLYIVQQFFPFMDPITASMVPKQSELLLLTFKFQTCLDLQFIHDSLSGKIYEYVEKNNEAAWLGAWCGWRWMWYSLLCGLMPVPIFKWKYSESQGDDKPNTQIN